MKREAARLDEQPQAGIISYTLQLRHAPAAGSHREITDQPTDADKARWLRPDEFQRRLSWHIRLEPV